MLTTPQEYVDSLPSPGKDWLAEFLLYMGQRHPDLSPVMFRQRPMFKVGKSYVLFSVADTHFTVHTLNFDLIEALRPQLKKASYGKGCVKIPFGEESAKPILKALCDEVVRLNKLDNPPPVDVVPDAPYEEKLAKAFSGGKARWLPLYEALRDQARESLPEFIEYFPAVNVLWKRGTTFAQVSAVSGAMRVEFFCDRERAELGAVKVQRLSANRVSHTVEVTGEAELGEVLSRIAESYALTQRKA